MSSARATRVPLSRRAAALRRVHAQGTCAVHAPRACRYHAAPPPYAVFTLMVREQCTRHTRADITPRRRPTPCSRSRYVCSARATRVPLSRRAAALRRVHAQGTCAVHAPHACRYHSAPPPHAVFTLKVRAQCTRHARAATTPRRRPTPCSRSWYVSSARATRVLISRRAAALRRVAAHGT
ncbi:unnamed protein product [Parnassius apollo]|uniref:(apollo) hypothetical protein n=1 Tax=Parnassius apollo TaxID=110799 RepID=A0A8S3Y4A8_PARAO|nr:unnamed protein product [Parnassius apollo]